jgi:rubrerythrin
MKLDKAIETALEYETGVHDIYREAMNQTADATAKRIFKVLCDEEARHLAYLRKSLDEWQRGGKINISELGSGSSTRKAIGRELDEVRRTVTTQQSKERHELELLERALDAEIQTCNFYRQMVASLDGDERELFQGFIQIEEGHIAIVQAEIDYIDNWGFWFDTAEFQLEAE